jgi:hypothetical protein
MQRLVQDTKPVQMWTKGTQGLSLKGEDLSRLSSRPWRGSGSAYVVTPENNGNPKDNILKCRSVAKSDYDKCNHKVLKFETRLSSQEEYDGLVSYFSSEMLNQCLGILRTSKSIVAATLNMLGIPEELETWTDKSSDDGVDTAA